MSSTSSLSPSTTDYGALLERLPITAAEREELLEVFSSFDPEHGMRAIIFNNSELALRMNAGEDGVRQWHAFRELLPKRNPFTLMPLPEVLLLMVRLSTLGFPKLSMLEGLKSSARNGAQAFATNPMFKIIWNSVDEDLMSYFEISAASNPTANFSETDIERVGTNHILVHIKDHYAFLSEMTAVPFYEGLIEMMGYTSEVSIEHHDDHDCTLDVSWS